MVYVIYICSIIIFHSLTVLFYFFFSKWALNSSYEVTLSSPMFHRYALPLPKAQAVAKETLVVWCSLASRLGLWALKAELEDLCFAVLQVAYISLVVTIFLVLLASFSFNCYVLYTSCAASNVSKNES